MGAVLFRCPMTGSRVTGWIGEDASEKGAFVAVACHACGRAHLVNPKTEKTLEEDAPDSREGLHDYAGKKGPRAER